MKLIAVRLPDEVAAEVEEQAKKQERSKSAVIVRALRSALDIDQNQNWEGPARTALVIEHHLPPNADLSQIVDPPRYRKCQHGDNEYTCPRIACKMKTGRA